MSEEEEIKFDKNAPVAPFMKLFQYSTPRIKVGLCFTF